MLLFTGCRRNEITSPKWNEVRLDEDCIALLYPKNGRSWIVRVNARASSLPLAATARGFARREAEASKAPQD